MKLLKPFYFDEFKCVGNNCLNHCCQNWKILIDYKSYQYYQSLDTPFGRELKQNIVTESSEHYFKLNEKKTCMYFNTDGLCDIYINLGEDKMCTTCKIYPRVQTVYADVIEQTLTLSCPEASKIIIETEEKLDFIFIDEVPTELKEISVDNNLYNILLKTRSCSIDIMQTRFFSLWERQLLLILFTNKIQKCLENNDYCKIENIVKQFSDINVLAAYVADSEKSNIKNYSSLMLISNFVNELILQMNNKTNTMNEIYNRLITDNQPMSLYNFLTKYKKHFDYYMLDKGNMYENFYVHTLFRYYMKALLDKNVLKQVVFVNINYLLIRTYQQLFWVDSDKKLLSTTNQLIMSDISITLEHNSEIYNQIYKKMENQNTISYAYQVLLLS